MQDQFIVVLIYFFLAMFAILLIQILRNIWKYVIKLKKYREFRIACFYLLATTIIFLRVTQSILILIMYSKSSYDSHDDLNFRMWIITYCCRQLENILGIQQLVSMIDLQLVIKYQALKLQSKSRDTRWNGQY